MFSGIASSANNLPIISGLGYSGASAGMATL
jgi:hypothetical protein